MEVQDQTAFEFDFFVSRRGVAAEQAKEVAEILEGADYKVLVQDFNFPYSTNFVAAIHDALKRARHFVGLLTEDYDVSPFTLAEWTSFFALAEPSGGRRRLIVLRVENVQPPGLLASLVYGDLFDKSEKDRRDVILAAAEGRSIGKRRGTKVIHGVPPHNPAFIGRNKLLEQLHKALLATERATAVTSVAIRGLGGVGKTSLAAEYAHQYADDYTGVWWAQAESRLILLESLAELDGVLDGPRGAHSGQDRRLETEVRAKSALRKLARSESAWLLVYDNVDDPDQIQDLIPNAGARLLITTRLTNLGRQAIEFEVDLLKPLEATRLLMKLAARNDRPGAVRLAKALGYLPLALDQAALYVKLTGMTFDRYADRAMDLIAKAPKGTNRTVAATFSMAIERAVADCPAASTLLSFLSVLAPEQIPRDLIDDTILAEDDRDQAVMALALVSLIRHEKLDGGDRALSIHRLVQAAMYRRLGETAGMADVLKRAIARLAAAYPGKSFSDPTTWPRCKQLLPHALALRSEAHRAGIETIQLAQLIDGVANYLLGRSAFADAEPLFKEVIEIGERLLGPNDKKIGEWLNNYGNLYLNSGRYDQAKAKYFQAISIGVHTLGRDSPQVATRTSNLGYAFMKSGQYKEAEGYFREAIDTTERAYGRQDFRLAPRIEKLAELLHETQRYPEAEALFREAIAIGHATVGRDNVQVCDWTSEFADLLRDAGRHEEAERLYREAIEILEKIVGDEHSSITFARMALAELLLKVGRLEQARQEASRAVAAQNELFGPHHRFTLDSVDVLGRVLAALGHGSEVDQLRREYGLARPEEGRVA